MFVEFRASKNHKRSYEKLVEFAEQNGISNVAGLDSRKTGFTAAVLGNPVPFDWNVVGKHAEKIGVPSEEYVKIRQYYGIYQWRERKWIIRLRSAQQGDIIVVHPDHAYRIAPLLGISRNKVIWIDKPTQSTAESRKWLHPNRLKKFKKLRDLVRADRRTKMKKPK